MDVEIRTKTGEVRRGDLVVTTKWQRLPAKSVPSVFPDDPNVEIREVAAPKSETPVAEEALSDPGDVAPPAAEVPAKGRPKRPRS